VGLAVTNRQVGAILGTAWGASIGYGIGSIFEQKQATKWLLIYWVATLALFCPLPAILFSDASLMLAGMAGALFGALVGLLAGTLHLWRLRRKA
jgi:hypothetical protein